MNIYGRSKYKWIFIRANDLEIVGDVTLFCSLLFLFNLILETLGINEAKIRN